jgi:hypothetical protein
MMQDAPRNRLSPDDVRLTCGALPDWKVREIIETNADAEALEVAVAWAAGDNENPPLRHLAPHSAEARVYEILMADEEKDQG